MSQLVALTVQDQTLSFAAGTIGFNCNQIQRLSSTAGVTWFLYNKNYRKNTPVKVYVDETEVEVQLNMGGAYITGVSLEVDVLEVNGVSSVYAQTIKVDDIVYVMADPNNADQSIIVANVSQVSVPVQYLVAHTFAYVLAQANAEVTPGGEEVWVETGPMDNADTEELFTDGVSGVFVLPGENTAWLMKANCLAVVIDEGASAYSVMDTFSAEYRLTAKNVAGSVVVEASHVVPITPDAGEQDGATWDFTAGASNNVEVTFGAPTGASQTYFETRVSFTPICKVTLDDNSSS